MRSVLYFPDVWRSNPYHRSKPNGVRLGYMGHLTLISEDVLTALGRFPPELRLVLIEYAPVPGWDEYVTGRYDETRKMDAKILGGGKPAAATAGARSVTKWKVDEGDGEDEGGGGSGKGEFRRTVGSGRPRNTADFGPAPVSAAREEEESQPAPQVRCFRLPLKKVYRK